MSKPSPFPEMPAFVIQAAGIAGLILACQRNLHVRIQYLPSNPFVSTDAFS